MARLKNYVCWIALALIGIEIAIVALWGLVIRLGAVNLPPTLTPPPTLPPTATATPVHSLSLREAVEAIKTSIPESTQRGFQWSINSTLPNPWEGSQRLVKIELTTSTGHTYLGRVEGRGLLIYVGGEWVEVQRVRARWIGVTLYVED